MAAPTAAMEETKLQNKRGKERINEY